MADPSTPDEVQHARSLCAVFQDTVRRRPDAEALRSSDGSQSLTWSEYDRQVRRIAAGFAALGVRPGDTVALMLTNRPEFHLVDSALVHLGATPFSIYNTSSGEQIDYLMAVGENRFVVCEGQFLDRIGTVREHRGIERIVCVDGPADGCVTLDDVVAAGDPGFDFDAAWRSVGRDDVATLIFTSGTTGRPKAVEVTHGNVLYSTAAIMHYPAALGGGRDGGRVLSYLPDAHMANRLFAHYVPIALAATTITVRDGKTVMSVARTAQPTVFQAVPMIWYKIKTAAEMLIAADAAGAATRAIEIGLAKSRLELAGEPVPAELWERYAEADRQVLAPLRAQLGLGGLVAGVSGGAPIAADALGFVMALGVPVLEGWAMSETAGAGIMNPAGGIRLGTLGRPAPGTEIRLADDGELLVRSPGVMKGYRNDPQRTAEAVDADGWLHTGDVVTIDDDGYVTIVDRKKELIINSAGKNMSPAHIENAVKVACSLAGSVIAVGDRRPYVVAIMTLDPEAAAAVGRQHGLTDLSPAALAGHHLVQAAVSAGIEAANATLSRVEQVRAFTVLPTYWLPDSDELTPTMKLKRRVIVEKYAADIDEIYSRPRL